MKTSLKIILFTLMLILTTYGQKPYHPDIVLKVSVSSNGNYAFTTSLYNAAILWNLHKKTYTIISKSAGNYSAYFIKNTNDFMWQNDKTHIVYIENVNGKIIKTFKNFLIANQVMTTDLKHYFACDHDWNLYAGYGKNQNLIKGEYDGGGGVDAGKLLNLTLSNNNKLLLTSGECQPAIDRLPISAGFGSLSDHKKQIEGANLPLMDGVVLWDVKSKKPIFKFSGNVIKTFATLSPDNNFIIDGDENSNGFCWNTKNGKKEYELDNIFLGKLVKTGKGNDIIRDYSWDNTGLIQPPDDFKSIEGFADCEAVFAIKFIDATHYLRFTTYVPYAILYRLHNTQPSKYLFLGLNPFPSVDYYSRDESIDTSVKAHILVTGQSSGNGINVYQYDPKTESLHLVWAAKL